MQLAAVDGDVLLSRAWIAGDHQPGRDVRAAVVLVVGGERKQPLDPRGDGRPPAPAPKPSRARGSDPARPLESEREPRPSRPPWPRPSSRGRKSARRRPGSDVRPAAETGWRATHRDAWRWLRARSAGQRPA